MTAFAEQEDVEFVLTDKHFRIIAKIIREEAGIALSPIKTTLVYSRLTKRLRALELESFQKYCDIISDPKNKEERRHLLSALTTNVTHFFREPHHFKHLADVTGPSLIDRARRGERVRLWSAACSSGQEPYSLALTLLKLAPDLADTNLKILATDIDPKILDQARNGEYEKSLLEKIPADLRARYFSRVTGNGELRVISDEVKSLISFRTLNLVRPWPVSGPFDAVFCRNVVIYFDEKTEQKVWSQFSNVIAPNGHLYIGHSERVTGPASNVLLPDGVTIYKNSC